MVLSSLEAIAAALEGARVRFLVAGGLAVNAHGHLRLTQDIDLVVQLVPDNIARAFAALGSLGYRPQVPVASAQFSDAAQREAWIRDKGMKVLNFYSDLHRFTAVDMFVTEPFDFDAEYRNALQGEITPGLLVRFVSIPTLIAMKLQAGRPIDLDDVQHLRWILDESKSNGPEH